MVVPLTHVVGGLLLLLMMPSELADDHTTHTHTLQHSHEPKYHDSHEQHICVHGAAS